MLKPVLSMRWQAAIWVVCGSVFLGYPQLASWLGFGAPTGTTCQIYCVAIAAFTTLLVSPVHAAYFAAVLLAGTCANDAIDDIRRDVHKLTNEDDDHTAGQCMHDTAFSPKIQKPVAEVSQVRRQSCERTSAPHFFLLHTSSDRNKTRYT